MAGHDHEILNSVSPLFLIRPSSPMLKMYSYQNLLIINLK